MYILLYRKSYCSDNPIFRFKYPKATTDRLACDVMFYLPGVKAVFTDNYKDLLPGHPFRTEIRTPLSKEEIEQQIRCRWVGK